MLLLMWTCLQFHSDHTIVMTQYMLPQYLMRFILRQWQLISCARWRHQKGILSALLAFGEGNPLVTGGFPSQRPVTRSFDILFDLLLNKRLSKQSGSRLFETPSGSLWNHSNGSTGFFCRPVYVFIIHSTYGCTFSKIHRPIWACDILLNIQL